MPSRGAGVAQQALRSTLSDALWQQAAPRRLLPAQITRPKNPRMRIAIRARCAIRLAACVAIRLVLRRLACIASDACKNTCTGNLTTHYALTA